MPKRALHWPFVQHKLYMSPHNLSLKKKNKCIFYTDILEKHHQCAKYPFAAYSG